MPLYFITGSKEKFAEAKAIMPFIEQVVIDLPEIQEIDAKAVVKEKLLVALKQRKGEFIVEDTSLYLDCLNGLPGPLIKWFLKAIGNKGLAMIAKKLKNTKATAKTIFGYAKSPKEIYFFEGSIRGNVVAPRGKFGFGWDAIFQPKGYRKTFAELSPEEKNKISMRRKALNKLKKFLEKSKPNFKV